MFEEVDQCCKSDGFTVLIGNLELSSKGAKVVKAFGAIDFLFLSFGTEELGEVKNGVADCGSTDRMGLPGER